MGSLSLHQIKDRHPTLHRILTLDALHHPDMIPLIGELMERGEIHSMIDLWLDTAAQSNDQGSPFVGAHAKNAPGEWIIARGSNMKISFQKSLESGSENHARQQDVHRLVTEDTILVWTHPGPGSLRVFEYEPIIDDQVFDPNRRLTSAMTRELKTGDSVFLRAGHSAFAILAAESHIFLKFSALQTSSIAWNMHGDDPRRSSVTPSSLADARLQVAVDMLVKFGCLDAIPELKRLAESHASYLVRWKATVGIVLLSEGAGLQQLRIACDDRHPYIRTIAHKTLEAYSRRNHHAENI